MSPVRPNARRSLSMRNTGSTRKSKFCPEQERRLAWNSAAKRPHTLLSSPRRMSRRTSRLRESSNLSVTSTRRQVSGLGQRCPRRPATLPSWTERGMCGKPATRRRECPGISAWLMMAGWHWPSSSSSYLPRQEASHCTDDTQAHSGERMLAPRHAPASRTPQPRSLHGH